MRLNDPFGRMERKHQAGYEAMRRTLQKGGITTTEAAQKVIEQARQRALLFGSIGTCILLLLVLILPKAIPLAAAFGIFMIVWLANSTINGKRYIEKYIEEDLEK